MHLLLIHQAFVSPKEPGGTRHYELTKNLVKSGHEVTIIASNISYLTGGSVIGSRGLFGRENLSGINLLRAWTYSALHKSFIWRVVSFISFMISSFLTALTVKNVDVIMGTSPPIFQAFSAWMVAAIKKKPFILEIRDLWPEFAIDMGVLKNKCLIDMSRRLEMFLYSRAAHFIVNSPAYLDYLISKGVKEKKISFISNGVDPDMFQNITKGNEFRNKWKLKDDFVVTYTGALGIANDISVIIRAANKLRDIPDIKFLLVGDGKEKRNLINLANELKIKNVIFTGSVPKSKMPAVIAASDLCVATLQNIPMFKTTYPNKVFDYMASQRPTILAIDGVIRKIIEDSGGGIFVPPGDDDSLAKAINQLRKDPDMKKKMGLDAKKYVSKFFNRKDHAKQFVELLEDIVYEKSI